MRIRSGFVSLCVAACVLVLGGGPVFSSAAGAAQPWNSTALPFSTPGPIEGIFNAVSCMSTTSCIAVGQANLPGYSEDTTAIVANLVGGTWVQGLLPLPSGATTASLVAVSCTSSQCQAVGSYSSALGGPSSALIETFSGGDWTATTAVQPSGVTNAKLTGVSCVSNSACTAVGNGNVYSGIFTDTLSRRDMVRSGPFHTHSHGTRTRCGLMYGGDHVCCGRVLRKFVGLFRALGRGGARRSMDELQRHRSSRRADFSGLQRKRRL